MASRIHVFDFDGDGLFWGQSAFGPVGAAAARGCEAHNDAAPQADRPEDSFAPVEPPTVRSARSWLELESESESAEPSADGSGIVVVTREIAEAIAVEEDEPCPETLRSPVSTGVSTTPRRTRVA